MPWCLPFRDDAYEWFSHRHMKGAFIGCAALSMLRPEVVHFVGQRWSGPPLTIWMMFQRGFDLKIVSRAQSICERGIGQF